MKLGPGMQYKIIWPNQPQENCYLKPKHNQQTKTTRTKDNVSYIEQ